MKWWMRKSNLDVRRKAGLPHKMEQVIQFKRLCWLGHVERMKETSLPKILLHGEIEYGKRPQRKPKKRWKDCVLNDLCDFGIEEKGLNDKVWAEKCKDRREWRWMLQEGLEEKTRIVQEKEMIELNTRQIRSTGICTGREMPDVTFVCPLCHKPFTTSRGMKQHIRQIHSNTVMR